MKTETYKIIKFRKSGRQTVMRRGLTLEEAKQYCSHDLSKGKTWFCGFTKEESR